MWNYLKHLLQLTLSPKHGWEDVVIDPRDPRSIAMRGFFPLTGITAATVFLQLLYHPGLYRISVVAMKAVAVFAMFFVAYFLATFVISVFLPPYVEGNLSERRVRTFALLGLGLLEIIAIISLCVPITLAITWFLPIYVAIILWKGAHFLHVKEGYEWRFAAIAVLGTVLSPYIIQFLLNLLIP